jgi:hypothetical protein
MRSRLMGVARIGAALTLLLGGVMALMGLIATSGDGAVDVLGVALMVLAIFPTLAGAVGLVLANRR